MILLILARLADIYTTLLNVNKWGWDVEGNPLMMKIGQRGLFFPYQLFVLGFCIVIAEQIPKYKRIIYVSVSAISLLASASNLFCYWFIK